MCGNREEPKKIKEMDHAPSQEQMEVINHVKLGKNVIVDACAGSGKSTTILSMATEMPETQFLQMTYNSMLRCEVKEKVANLGLKNIQVHTYHSLAVKYYLPTAHTDTGIRHIILDDRPTTTKLPKFDVVVLDEAQDMTFLYFQLVVKMIKDMNHKIQLLILGDYLQGLYEFKGADTRFLTHANEIWSDFPALKSQDFEKCLLKTSYRITKSMADFVNNIMLGEERLLAQKEGGPVIYIRNSRKNMEKIVTAHILRLLQEEDTNPSDIFILGASVKGPNSNIRKLENALSSRGIPCHVPMFETDKIDERVIEGKVVFSTFHSVKGRQRKYVVVVGFDNGYMDFYARNLPKTRCPNTLYVAATRATTGMLLLENNQFSTDRPLEFLKMGHHEMIKQPFIDFRGLPQSIFYEKHAENNIQEIFTHHVTPTDLIKFISEQILENVTPILDRIFVQETEPHMVIEMPNVVRMSTGLYEEVSDLNGIAIPTIYYDYLGKTNPKFTNRGTNILYDTIEYNCTNIIKPNEHEFLKDIFRELPRQNAAIQDYLYLSNVYVSVQEKLYFKLKQIPKTECTWLSDEIIVQCTDRMDNILANEIDQDQILVEEDIIQTSEETKHVKIDQELYRHFGEETKFRFSARTDLITPNTIWEIKCTSAITVDHMLQVVIYAWLWRMVNAEEPEKKVKILNIKTGEIMKLESTTEQLTEIVVALLRGKYGNSEMKDDANFIQDCKNTIVEKSI